MRSLPHNRLLLTLLIVMITASIPTAAQITIEVASTHRHGGWVTDSPAEKVVYDAGMERIYVTRPQDNSVDVIDISDPFSPQVLRTVDLSAELRRPNDIDLARGLVAVVAHSGPEHGSPGRLVLLDLEGNVLDFVDLGPRGHAVRFTDDGRQIVVGCQHSVRIVDLSHMPLQPGDIRTVDFGSYDGKEDLLRALGVYVPEGASASTALIPENLTVSPRDRTAWVTLQENNAIAVIDLRRAKISRIFGLGYKWHMLPGNGLDASDMDDEIRIENWPVRGMYRADGIHAFRVRGATYYLLANEGNGHYWQSAGPYPTETTARVSALELDPELLDLFPGLQDDENLGRLEVLRYPPTGTYVDENGDTVYRHLYSLGGRSFSILNALGWRVYESGSEFARVIAERYPDNFNSHWWPVSGTFDWYSDSSGCEPESVITGEVDGRTYAFIALERMSGIMIYDVTRPWFSRFVDYVNNRNFDTDDYFEAKDIAPEGMAFIGSSESPTGEPLLVVTNEFTGTTTIYTIVSN
jgi:hypothetical protein